MLKLIFIKGVTKLCKPNVIIASSSLRVSLDDIFECSVFKEVRYNIGTKFFHNFSATFHFQRCIGIRFLYPVFCIPEVELTKSSHTSIDTVETCKILK